MQVYIVRHGQSETNLTGYHCGQEDVPLTPKGIEDACKAGEKLRKISFDRVFSSDLMRTIQTAKAALPGCEPEQYELIREINVGRLAGNLISECASIFGEDYYENRRKHDFLPYNGENHEMHLERVSKFMKMLESLENCENVAVFTHEGSIHCMLQYVLELPVDRWKLKVDNGAVTVLEYANNVWSLRKFNA